ncbi:FG-GAP repeat domain-containing protein [Pseudoroseicyclus tamaricis]|uniref:VCBS repeat-containing protein n=1 Tax=Pseudoroseicyclus tamaricis TaxID=2705421 RepID=A0A6B2JGR5_9RHOB|nr:VCBS repeat-containing protein [Pseudoroseicyclus tamaricis]NDV00391.1 VCBS repeat-containing protein [Pseudoroseicyclus tamaricis]
MRAAALLGLLVWGTAALPQEAPARVLSASYGEPTGRYDHGILGDAIEWGALTFQLEGAAPRRLRLPETRVFEDIAPRLADMDGDGSPEAVVVESDLSLGARLAVYGPEGLVAATEFIGQSHRWLAPVGAADLDGDGRLELAYVDRPHLARILRVVRQEGERLVEVAALEGVTNHRIGEDHISGGIRECGGLPEMIVASPDWATILSVTMADGALAAREIGPATGPASFAAALAC